MRYLTSYSDTSGTTAVNQVKYEYNGWGRVSREYQEHDGTVDGSTLLVQYDYADGASGGVAKYVRLDEVTYPNGREVHYDYGTTAAIDDIMSRLASIGDGTNAYASYKYLGAGRIVTEDYEDIEVKLTYLDSSGNVAGLDRFGRVADQFWADYGENPIDEYTYTYDRVGNRTGRDNELHSAFDEDYTYDGLNRLTDSDRADAFDQTWTLDGLGNFSAFDDDGSSQTRTANAVNEITGITGGWITPGYDDAGNVISGPKPGDEDTRIHYVYDARNRLVAVKADNSGNPGNTIATYKYDGLKRRIEKVVTGTSDVHYYYDQDWQMLEERFVNGGTLLASNQYMWSARYIDSPVVRHHDGNGDGDYLDAGDNIRHYTTDANHNVTATIDAATGGIVERYVYNAYGKATVYSPTWTNAAAPSTDGPLYCGYFFDAESGLYQVRNRYYNSGLSTFISRDPIEADINLYRYCDNRPANAIDPLGLAEWRIEEGHGGLHIQYGNCRWDAVTLRPIRQGNWTCPPLSQRQICDLLRSGAVDAARNNPHFQESIIRRAAQGILEQGKRVKCLSKGAAKKLAKNILRGIPGVVVFFAAADYCRGGPVLAAKNVVIPCELIEEAAAMGVGMLGEWLDKQKQACEKNRFGCLSDMLPEYEEYK